MYKVMRLKIEFYQEMRFTSLHALIEKLCQLCCVYKLLPHLDCSIL